MCTEQTVENTIVWLTIALVMPAQMLLHQLQNVSINNNNNNNNNGNNNSNNNNSNNHNKEREK